MVFKRCWGFIIASVLCLISFQAMAVDWSAVSSQQIVLFNPGTASWEKMLMGDTHDGANGVRKKTPCNVCHDGDQAAIGQQISTDQKDLFYKQVDHPSSYSTHLKMVIEDGVFYFAVELPSISSGRVSLLLDDNSYMHTGLSGCWSSCHDDSQGMPSAGNMQLSKYLSLSRTDNTKTGGGESYKPSAELTSLMANGQYLELLGATFSTEGVEPFHGYVLDKRHMGSADKMSSSLVTYNDKLLLVVGRALASSAQGFKNITSGNEYSAGLALHWQDGSGASHLVSLPIHFMIDDAGSITFSEE